MNSPSPSKGNLDNLFLGSTATTFLQQFRTEAGVRLEEDQADARLGQQDQGIHHRKHDNFRFHQTDLLSKYVQIR